MYLPARGYKCGDCGDFLPLQVAVKWIQSGQDQRPVFNVENIPLAFGMISYPFM